MLVACVALLGLAQWEAQASDESGEVITNYPEGLKNLLEMPVPTDAKGLKPNALGREFQPTEEQMKSPLGAYVPELDEEGWEGLQSSERREVRIETFLLLEELGMPPIQAVDFYCRKGAIIRYLLVTEGPPPSKTVQEWRDIRQACRNKAKELAESVPFSDIQLKNKRY